MSMFFVLSERERLCGLTCCRTQPTVAGGHLWLRVGKFEDSKQGSCQLRFEGRVNARFRLFERWRATGGVCEA